MGEDTVLGGNVLVVYVFSLHSRQLFLPDGGPNLFDADEQVSMAAHQRI
jgi:hypothetical protein